MLRRVISFLASPFIHNIRLGFATNSSSSHSVVYFTNPVCGDDISPGGCYDTEYGWDDFELDTLGEKLMYALTTAIGEGRWGSKATKDEALEAMRKYGHLFPELDASHFAEAINGYVDHQSVGNVEDLVKVARNPKAIILGGNDNSYWNPVDEYEGHEHVTGIYDTDCLPESVIKPGE